MSFTARLNGPLIKALLASLLFLSFSLHVCVAGTKPQAQQLLNAAAEQANFFDQKAGLFQLEIDFRAQIQTPIHGHMTLRLD